MSVRLVIGLTVCAMALAGCGEAGKSAAPNPATRPQAAQKPPLSITLVRADRLSFDPAKGESATIHFTVDKAADIELSVYDGRNRRVRRIEGGRLSAGEHQLSWDGLDEQKRQVPSEAYAYTLTATTTQGARVSHDLTDLTGGEALTVKDVRWDPGTGKVHYRLDKPARVNIRFGLQDGPHLRTLVDWVPRTAGAQAESWDGWDASHALALASHPMLATSVKAYSLPDNTLFVGQRVEQVAFATLADQAVRPRQATTQLKRMYFHADQPLEARGDINASLAIDGAGKQDQEGRWIVSGRVPVRLEVAKADRARVLERRFEPVFFVDGTFAFENEVGFLPMTWNWDTSTVNEGEHFVTVNVRGYEGNFGAATVKVWVVHPVANPQPATASKSGGAGQ